ncbi:MAG: hypothetical protein FRX49_04444 [Trebouxia sp. A1-2]|nr:MAG: hypothetical protein FRX49_04444 [Trebouxia sp. A1-2]
MPATDSPCPVTRGAPDVPPVANSKTLTENQKKKRRHKLAKLAARQQASVSLSESCVSDSTVAPAASEASNTAFANNRQALISRASVAGLAADPMASTGPDDRVTAAEPSTSTAESNIGTGRLTVEQAAPSALQPKNLSVQVSSSVCSRMVASCASASPSTREHPNSASPVTTSPAQLATHALKPDPVAPACRPPVSLICRIDMSAAALAVHASFVPQAVHTSSASPPDTDAHEAEQSAKRQKRVFIHGNYNRYYGYRLDRRWFHGKRCLDIGCNEGVITLAAVQRFAPMSMLGVDIDEGLIKTACRALSKQRTEASNLHQRLTRHTSSGQPGDRPAAQRKAAAAAVRAFANVWFTCEDFAASQHTPQSLDTIMCLSVTKWVHLNQGDEGLKRLFGKVKEALVPGGWFILEPQPWRSYQQARRKQDMSAAPFAKLDMLKLRPEGFPDYLEQELGFMLARELHVATSSAGFNRPMYLFQRGT